MRTKWLVGIVMLALSLPVAAQPVEGEPPPDAESAEPQRPPRGPRSGRWTPEVVADHLRTDLELTPEQLEQFDAIAARYQERWTQEGSRMDEMRELARQYREARESGDNAAAEQVREKMRAARGGQSELLRAFIAEVEPLLDEQQLDKLQQFRQRMRRGFVGLTGPGAGLHEIMQRLPDELSLTPEQRAQYDELVSQQRAETEALRAHWRELMPLREELRKARQAGDTARVAELEKQIEESRPQPPNPQAFLDKLNTILTDEQKTKLAELQQRYAARGPDVSLDARTVLSAAKRLRLTDEQQERLKEIQREALSSRGRGGDERGGERPRGDRRAQDAMLGQQVKTQILAILDAEQAKEFEQLLAKAARPGDRRGGPGNRPHRGERPGDEPPPPPEDQPGQP